MLQVLMVTGPLGAGKTTVVNRLLKAQLGQGHRVAVLINEFGAVSVDGLLVDADRPELADNRQPGGRLRLLQPAGRRGADPGRLVRAAGGAPAAPGGAGNPPGWPTPPIWWTWNRSRCWPGACTWRAASPWSRR